MGAFSWLRQSDKRITAADLIEDPTAADGGGQYVDAAAQLAHKHKVGQLRRERDQLWNTYRRLENQVRDAADVVRRGDPDVEHSSMLFSSQAHRDNQRHLDELERERDNVWSDIEDLDRQIRNLEG